MLQLLYRELEQYERFKQEERPLEVVYLKLRTLIQEVKEGLRGAPDNEDLQDRLRQLEGELAELEGRVPWLIADYPVEMGLWGAGSGLL